ncbi:MAG: YlbF family regulator [Vagococcus sp.]
MKLIFNEDIFKIEDLVLTLSNELLSSKLVDEYLNHYSQLDSSEDVEKLIKEFNQAKEQFEKIEQYGHYAPDFKEKRRALRKVKRKLDTHEDVAAFKFAETSLQNVLDYLSLDISKTISDDVKVDAGNPFFEFAKKGCGGSCHVS